MSSFAHSIPSPYSTHRPSLRSWIQTNVSWLNIATFVLVLVMCFFYIAQVNHAVSKGYQIRDLETQVNSLSLLNQKLEVETQQAQALTNVARATKMLGLVKAGQPEYLQSTGPAYALVQ